MEELFRLFKNITNEEGEIIKIIKENIKVSSLTSILDIGSNSGYISSKLQPQKNKI